jgi:formylmethanofuran dehydrogenase subunit C
MARATGSFDITSMGEDTYAKLEGDAKLTKANGTQTFSGDIEGEGSVEWLMCYSPEGGAHYVGLQRVEGSLGGRSGSFVIEAAGSFDGKQSTGTWRIIAGSGSGELTSLTGEGSFEAPGGPTASYSLEYELG